MNITIINIGDVIEEVYEELDENLSVPVHNEMIS